MKLPAPVLAVIGGVTYVLVNFAASLVFYITFHQAGAKAAIALALIVTGIQLFFHRLMGIKPTFFFKVTTLFVVIFGGTDLFLSSPKFFRLEPFAQNFLVASAFLASYLSRVPLFHRLALELPKKFRPSEELPEAYYRKLTITWVSYLYLKAALFLWIALSVDLGSLILWRSVIGGVTLALLFVGELIYRKKYLAKTKSTTKSRAS